MKIEIIKEMPESSSDKRPILFVHGAWHAAWCWEKYFLRYFAEKGYPAYALSLSNHGKTKGKKSLNWTFISDYVNDLDDVINTFEKKPIVVGHSMGGLVVQKYLEINSLPGVVLLASVPPSGVFRTTLKIAKNHFIVFLLANLTWNLYRLVGTEKRAKELFFSSDMEAGNVSEYFKKLQGESYLAFLLGMLFPRIKHYKQAKVPMLVLGAEKDEIFTKCEIESTAEKYNTKPNIIRGIAHDMMLESKWRDVAEAIIEWLEK